jgi:hypothetical protein
MDYGGLGAFFYPVVLAITDKEKPEITDSELGKPPGYKTRKIVLDYHFDDKTRIVLTDDGFVGIFKDNTTEVLEILNIIFATGITFGVGSAFVRDEDLCNFTLHTDGKHIQLDEIGGPSERNMYSFQRDEDSKFVKWSGIKYGERYGRKTASIQDMKKVLDKSYDYLSTKNSKKNVYEDLLLALDGYALHYRGAYKGAYVYGWTIIETIIDQLWEEFVTTLKISSDDKSNLKESNHWTAYHKIEMLFALEKIDLTNRNFLTKLRRKRNKVIHDREKVDWDEAFGCLRLAIVMILNRMLCSADIFHDPKGNDLIKKWNCSREEE